MTNTKTLTTSLLSLSAAALLALCTAGGATAAPAPLHDQDTSQVASATVDNSSSAEFWTADRMRAAIPGDVLADEALARGLGSTPSAVETGASTKIDGKAAQGQPTLRASETPVTHIGKVFFTQAGSNYVCSGNSVVSANKSTVSTAGHCLNKGPGAFATNFIFVPAYLDGAAPYGKWAAKVLYAPTQWLNGGSIQYDTGFAVVAPLNGRTLSDTVGASGVQFNAARGLTYKAFGYPARPPFDGESLKSCTGTAINDTIQPESQTQGITCDMTGGSSGGPWFIGTSSSGYQNSVNSYRNSLIPGVMFGPYWGSVIQQTYSDAAAA